MHFNTWVSSVLSPHMCKPTKNYPISQRSIFIHIQPEYKSEIRCRNFFIDFCICVHSANITVFVLSVVMNCQMPHIASFSPADSLLKCVCLKLCLHFPRRNMTLSGFKDSVMELIHFVGRLASVGLQLEGCHSLLLSFILDFYETVNELMLMTETALFLC